MSDAPTSTQPKLLISGDELASQISLCVRSLYTLRKQGMPHVKIGSMVLYSPTKCLAWLEEKYGKAGEK